MGFPNRRVSSLNSQASPGPTSFSVLASQRLGTCSLLHHAPTPFLFQGHSSSIKMQFFYLHPFPAACVHGPTALLLHWRASLSVTWAYWNVLVIMAVGNLESLLPCPSLWLVRWALVLGSSVHCFLLTLPVSPAAFSSLVYREGGGAIWSHKDSFRLCLPWGYA